MNSVCKVFRFYFFLVLLIFRALLEETRRNAVDNESCHKENKRCRSSFYLILFPLLHRFVVDNDDVGRQSDIKSYVIAPPGVNSVLVGVETPVRVDVGASSREADGGEQRDARSQRAEPAAQVQVDSAVADVVAQANALMTGAAPGPVLSGGSSNVAPADRAGPAVAPAADDGDGDACPPGVDGAAEDGGAGPEDEDAGPSGAEDAAEDGGVSPTSSSSSSSSSSSAPLRRLPGNPRAAPGAAHIGAGGEQEEEGLSAGGNSVAWSLRRGWWYTQATARRIV
jgi:hypothetical protein